MKRENIDLCSEIDLIANVLSTEKMDGKLTRKNLVGFLYNERVIQSEFGIEFLYSLLKDDRFDDNEYRLKVREDINYLGFLIRTSKSWSCDEYNEIKKIYKDKENRLLSYPLGQYIYKIGGKEISEAAERIHNENRILQQKDVEFINELVSHYDLTTQRDIDKLSELLEKNGYDHTNTIIGKLFLSGIREKSSKANEIKRKILSLKALAAVSALAAVIPAVIVFIIYIKDYRNAVINEYVKGLHNDEERISPGVKGSINIKDTVYQYSNSFDDDVLLEDEPEIQGDIQSGTGQFETLGETNEIKTDVLEEYSYLTEMNGDTVGWLSVKDTEIDYAVLKSSAEDDFYLHHDFSKEKNRKGAIFIDKETSINPNSDCIVIYGHNMKDGTMFGSLKRFLNKSFYEGHRTFSFDTLFEKGEYTVIAVIVTHILDEDEEGFRYYRLFDYDEDSFNEFQNFLIQNSIYDIDIMPEYGDKFVLLSTCEYSSDNGRLVVVGKKS